jgi:prepilin-type N-terminal cleavage/methylation domain-containing protein
MNRYGFTLIELMVTIAILGLLLFIISPNITTSMDDIILQSECHRIAQDLRLTQQLAIIMGKDYCFEIHVTEKYYSVRPRDPTQKSYKREEIDPRLHTITCTFDSKYGGDYSGLKVLVYTPTGIPTRTGSITLQTKDGKTKRITVMVATGRVRIY